MPAQLLTCALIVAFSSLTIAIMDGARHGAVLVLTNRLLTSPTALRVELWVAKENSGLTRTMEESLSREIPELALVVPDIKKTAKLENAVSGIKVDVSLLTTKPRDPYLMFYGITAPQEGERTIVLTRPLAKQLGINSVTDHLPLLLHITRDEDGGQGQAELEVSVAGVIDTGEQESAIAFLDRDVMDAIEDFQQGRAVPDLGWPGVVRPVPVSYRGFVAWSKSPFTEIDFVRLQSRGLDAEELYSDRTGAIRRSLSGLVNDDGLLVYWVRPSAATTSNELRVSITPEDIERLTDADDVVLPCCEPVTLDLGVTGRPRWLKECIRDPGSCFPVNAPELSAYVIDDAIDASQPDRTIAIPFAGSGTINLQVVSNSTCTVQASNPIVTVPAPLLAHLEMLAAGSAAWDSSTNTFTRPASENTYYLARAYARRLDDVPTLDAELQQRGFTTESARTRVEENREHLSTIVTLVWLVGGCTIVALIAMLVVLFFGATDQQRQSIGILRVMGVSRFDIFVFMVIRALATGVCGAAMTIVFALVAVKTIDLLVLPCVVIPLDLAVIAGGSILLPCIGVLWPAWYASRLDPADAITSGRIR
jgi:putative ABC transport system permease protein